MAQLPDKEQQILQSHAGLIQRVVMACQNRELAPDLDEILELSEKNGWTALVRVLRKILDGERSEGLLRGLDDEDQVIVHAVLRGIQNPDSLKELTGQVDAQMAAPGLAAMIHAVRRGNTETLQVLSGMAQHMMAMGGDMARVAAALHPLISGERDLGKLTKGMSSEGRKLIERIIEELEKLDAH